MKCTRILVLVLSAMLSPSGWAAKEACHDADKVYKVCQDQEKLYQGAFDQAKAKDKMLVVVLGADWCPWCVSLHKMLSAPSFGGGKQNFLLTDIGLYQGKEKLESGRAVLKKLQEQAGSTEKIAGVPVMAVVNPKNGKAVLVNTEPLEKNTKTSKGHDEKKVLAALEGARSTLQ